MQRPKIYIAGHTGLAGSALVRRLKGQKLILRTHKELDLCDFPAVVEFFKTERPEYVYAAAGVVGGIQANELSPVEFLRDNLVIAVNVIEAAYNSGVKKLLYLTSSCMYPKDAPQPLREESLLSGALEPHVQGYALAKLSGMKLCQAYRKQYGFNAITAIPTNLYGPQDNYDPETSHVVAALIAKIKSTKDEVTIWGTGRPRREFMHADDLADACVFLMQNYNESAPINVGTGHDISVKELAELIGQIAGFRGRFVHDTTKPEGVAQKLLDTSRLDALGWKAKIPLAAGLSEVFYENQ